jgi:hypothetical protein
LKLISRISKRPRLSIYHQQKQTQMEKQDWSQLQVTVCARRFQPCSSGVYQLAGKQGQQHISARVFFDVFCHGRQTDAYRVPASPENALLAGAAGVNVFYALCSRARVLIVIIIRSSQLRESAQDLLRLILS